MQAEAGSGFVVRPDGTIVTSLQVVQQCLSSRSPPGKPLRNARPVSVALQDGRRLEGRITAIDRQACCVSAPEAWRLLQHRCVLLVAPCEAGGNDEGFKALYLATTAYVCDNAAASSLSVLGS